MTFLATFLPALLFAQTDIQRLADLNRQADQHLEAYELDKAEPLLEQALDIATRLDPVQEALAHGRLADLYMELQKRDGRDWVNLAVPQLFRTVELGKRAPAEFVNQIAAKLPLSVLQLPPRGQRPNLSPQYGKVLERSIAQIELNEGPLSPRTASAYHALSYSATGSEGQLHASYACDLLAGSSQTPAPEFSTLLLDCAEIDLHGLDEQNAIRLARLARKSAAGEGRRYAYETVLSYVIEAEAESSLVNHIAARSAIDSATALALKSLSPGHEIWERIQAVSASLTRTGRPGAARELVRRFDANADTPKDSRIQPAKPITKVEPEYNKEARAEKFEGSSTVAVLITPDGKGKAFITFKGVPYGLGPNVEKAVSEWTFQPWTKDGKPVPGVSVIEVRFQLKN